MKPTTSQSKSQEIELRKWCFEQTRKMVDKGSSTIETAQKLFDWVTEGKMPEPKIPQVD